MLLLFQAAADAPPPAPAPAPSAKVTRLLPARRWYQLGDYQLRLTEEELRWAVSSLASEKPAEAPKETTKEVRKTVQKAVKRASSQGLLGKLEVAKEIQRQAPQSETADLIRRMEQEMEDEEILLLMA